MRQANLTLKRLQKLLRYISTVIWRLQYQYTDTRNWRVLLPPGGHS